MFNLAYPLIRPVLFSMDAERAHEWTLNALEKAPDLWASLARLSTPGSTAKDSVDLCGLRLANPIGLAAGLDKNGIAIPFWPSLGFGFIEVGTVTAHPQPGNPQPRLFRLPEERALINRMGFNNEGSEALAHRLRTLREAGRWPDVPVGANIGKSKITPIEAATSDYITSIERLVGLADYFTINVSSPNTPGLRKLQSQEHLTELLPATFEAAKGTPVFLKLAPDLTDEAIQEAVDLAIASGISAIIATNTTIRRDLLTRDPNEAGGMSGAPLWPFARDRILAVLKASDGRIPVVGVGGIRSVEQAVELLNAGCVALQLYSALIFDGPGLPSKLATGIRSQRSIA
jgi:dihydroorotate dehydrogenase